MPILSRQVDPPAERCSISVRGSVSRRGRFRPRCPPIAVRALADTAVQPKRSIVRWVFDRLEDRASESGTTSYTASTGHHPDCSMKFIAVDLILSDGHRRAPCDKPGCRRGGGPQRRSTVEALFGRDILGRGLLVYDGLERRFALAIEPPSPLSVDPRTSTAIRTVVPNNGRGVADVVTCPAAGDGAYHPATRPGHT